MQRVSKSLVNWIRLFACVACLLAVHPSFAQEAETSPEVDKGEAYYRFSVGHLYHRLAMQHSRQEYVEQAVTEYTAAMAADPTSSFIPQELMQLYASSGRMEDAVRLGNDLAEKNPQDAEIRRLLGQIYQGYAYDRRGQFNRESGASAIAEFEKALAIEPDHLDTLQSLGRLSADMGDAEAAEQFYVKVLDLEPADAQALAGLARIYVATGETEKAIEALEQVVETQGSSRRYLEPLAQAYTEAGRFDDAAEIFRQLVEDAGTNGGNALAYRSSYADSLLRAGEFSEAREQYQQLVEIQPRNAVHHLRLAQIDQQNRRFERAWTHMREAERLDSGNLDIKYSVVRLLEAERRYDEAADGVRQILEDTEQSEYEPGDLANRLMFLDHLATIERQREDFDAARGVYAQIAELQPDAADRAQALVIDTYRAEKDTVRALEASAQASEEYPDSGAIAMQRATILAENGQAAEGAEIIEGLMSGDVSDADLYLTLAQMWEKGDNLDKALEAIDAAAELVPDNKVPILFSKASILERFKKLDESEAAFRELLEIDPDNSGALNYLGYMLADRGVKLDEAHDMIQRALDLEPENGAYLDSLGWVYYRQEKFDLAERQLLRSLERYGRDPVVLSHLGDVYQKLGDDEKAADHWRQGLEEWRRTPKADQDSDEIESLEAKLAAIE